VLKICLGVLDFSALWDIIVDAANPTQHVKLGGKTFDLLPFFNTFLTIIIGNILAEFCYCCKGLRGCMHATDRQPICKTCAPLVKSNLGSVEHRGI
jgi:hypothetical protein